MKRELVDYVACLNCKSSLNIKIFLKENEEILDGVLNCKKCSKEYFIINGVPRMISLEFENNLLRKYKHFFKRYNLEFQDFEEKKQSDVIKTVNSFGYEWKIFQKLYSIYEDQFLDWIYPVKKELFKNKLVLDAGCGTGRHTYFSAKYGAKTIGIDLSEAVDIAFKNTGNLKNVNIIQADIYNAPFREKTFDYIYSIGVLHHLPNPQKGFDCLVNLLKNNKYISVWVYGKENNALLRIADPLRETVLSKLPLQINYYLALILAISLYPIMAMYNLTDIFVKEDRIKSALPQFNFLIYLSKLKFKIIHSIIFDQMLAPIANYYTKSEFEKWFKDAKLKKVYISWRNKNSWRGMGKK